MAMTHLNCWTSILMQVPIMLRSKYCQLEGQTEHELTMLGECPLDQAGTYHS